MSNITASLRLLAFLMVSLSAMLVQLIALLLRSKASRRIPHHYFRLVARILGMRVTLQGPRPANGPALIAANHASWLDIVAFSALLPVVFVAKQEVASWPFFGTLSKLGQTIFINRESRHATGRARNQMKEALAQGRLVILFPEGTSSDGNRVLPFRSSLVGAAEEASGGGVPVIPATIAYTGLHGLPLPRSMRPRFAWFGAMPLAAHLWGVGKSGPFDVVIRFHETLNMESEGGRKALTRKAEAAVRTGLQSLLTGRERGPDGSLKAEIALGTGP
jgi:lyso-ornithine lipid O-acyltransferase